MPERDAWKRLAAERLEAVQLPRRERPQLLGRKLEGLHRPRFDEVVSSFDGLGRHFQCLEVHAIKLLSQPAQRRITFVAHLTDEFRNELRDF